jgi:hypothetical protein
MSRDRTKTVLQLKTEIRNQIWASGEPENLVTAHDEHFQEAFAEIAKWVPLCERDDNVDVFRFNKTFFKNGMTVFEAPRGIIQRVFTVANEDYTDPVYIQNRSWPWPESWARNLYLFPLPDMTKAGKLAVGFMNSDPNNDSLYGRSRTGVWAQYQKNLYIAPWIQSNEMVVVEWRGIKLAWEDLDLINPEQNYRKAVKLYVQYCHERDYGSLQDSQAYHNTSKTGSFDEALADLIHECNERQQVRNEYPQQYERNRICSEIADDAPIVGVTNLVLAHCGNMTPPGENIDDVGRLMRNWGPYAVLGTRFIDDVNTDYDATAGDQFHDYMDPYPGNKGPGAEDGNALWPAPSQQDWDFDNLRTYEGFFPLGGNRRYYSVVIGDVSLFFIDSAVNEPDGNTSGSTQGAWLQAQLALATTSWKIVVMYHAPWGSLYSDANLQWPFKSWGADLVICGQALNYERLDISGLPVINDGLGGLEPVEPIGIYATANTKSTYAAKPGALRINTKDKSLVAEFWTKDGELIDTLELSKP